MTEPLVRVAQREGVATLTLNDPARLNALTPALVQAALAAVHALRSDAAVRVLVLRGAGRAFCVGANLADFGPDAPPAHTQIDKLLGEGGTPLVLALQDFPAPVLSAVHGAAAGGGAGLALAADVVVAARSAFFSLPFVPALGLVPDLACTWVMQRAIGTARTAALTLLGDRLPAEQAAAWGLIWACVDDAALDAQVDQLATRLAALPPHGVVETRALLREGRTRSYAEQLAYEHARQTALAADPCFAEGVQAFLGKRAPAFPARSGGRPV